MGSILKEKELEFHIILVMANIFFWRVYGQSGPKLA